MGITRTLLRTRLSVLAILALATQATAQRPTTNVREMVRKAKEEERVTTDGAGN